MKAIIRFAAIVAVAVAATGCDHEEVDARISGITQAVADAVLMEPAEATGSLGLNLQADYPRRDTQYSYEPGQPDGLTASQLNSLFFLAFPQSDAAMRDLLGGPTAIYDNVYYWPIAGGNSELAVFYVNGFAHSYTLGQ